MSSVPAPATETPQTALSALLASLGFARMAEEVLTESAPERLTHYARIVLRNTVNVDLRRELVPRLRALGLVP